MKAKRFETAEESLNEIYRLLMEHCEDHIASFVKEIAVSKSQFNKELNAMFKRIAGEMKSDMSDLAAVTDRELAVLKDRTTKRETILN